MFQGAITCVALKTSPTHSSDVHLHLQCCNCSPTCLEAALAKSLRWHPGWSLCSGPCTGGYGDSLGTAAGIWVKMVAINS